MSGCSSARQFSIPCQEHYWCFERFGLGGWQHKNQILLSLILPVMTFFQIEHNNSQLIFILMQALFRKIAAALPGMETLSSTKQEDMVDVNLRATNSNASNSQPQSGGCSC